MTTAPHATALTLTLLLATTLLGAVELPLPVPLELAHILGKGLPAGESPVALTDELFVLAMGPSNAMAYLERRTMPDGTLVPRIRVQDLVEDQILWEKIWVDWGEPEAFAPWWEERRGLLGAVWRAFDLEPLDYQLGQFPLILEGEFDTALLRKTPGSDGSAAIGRLEVVVEATGRGIKTVHDSVGSWQWATLAGFIPSPYENRLALVLLVQPVGWAGAEQPLRFLVTGASLKAGFTQP